MLSPDPGPMREFRPFLDVDLDEAHATELLGKLTLALETMRGHATAISRQRPRRRTTLRLLRAPR
jgi:hypothetical protein